jgi:hypothetical protein
MRRSAIMRRSGIMLHVVAIAGAAMALTAAASSAQAQNYPWCAHYGTPYDDTSCGFVSYEQCMASVSGIGGFCEKNDTYKPPLAVRPQTYRHHAKNS